MTSKQITLLKITGLLTTVIYIYSMLWVPFSYLYGALFEPLKLLGLNEPVHLEIFIVLISVTLCGFILFKLKGQTFWKVLFQDMVLIIISVPFFWMILNYFITELDEPGLRYHFVTTFVLALLTINLNDWIKTGKASE